jgi:glyoxylase-like metal-dependent hydrolase (beta-lactamase superfamily II)
MPIILQLLPTSKKIYWLQSNPRPPIGTGQRIRLVQETFAPKYNIPKNESEYAFGYLFDDNEKFTIGDITAQVLHLPGHTPDHSGYLIGSNVFTGG